VRSGPLGKIGQEDVNPSHPEDRINTSGIVKLLVELDLARFWQTTSLSAVYPLANPLRGPRRLLILHQIFWTGVSDPVIRFFEPELTESEWDGLIAVGGDDSI
jgi:hypothetical protein